MKCKNFVNRRFTILCLLCFIIAVGTYFAPIIYFSYQHTWQHEIENFEDCEKDFQVIADFTQSFFEEAPLGQRSIRYLDISLNGNTGVAGINYYNSSKQQWEHVPLDDNQQESLNIIAQYPHSDRYFNEIRYCNEQITFCFETDDTYAIVYTLNGKRPHFMTKEHENADVRIKKIDKHWYHVATKH